MKREIILEDSAIVEDEVRANSSYDSNNGEVVAEVYPRKTCLPWVKSPVYDASVLPDSLRACSASFADGEFKSMVQKITEDYRFKRYYIMCGRALPFLVMLSMLLICVAFLLTNFSQVVVVVPLYFFGLLLFSLFAIFMRRKVRSDLAECFRSLNRTLLKYDLLVGIRNESDGSFHKIIIVFLHYRISDCVPSVERALFAKWASERNGRVDIERSERKDRAIQLILSESYEYVLAVGKKKIMRNSKELVEGTCHSAKVLCLCRFIVNRNFIQQPADPSRVKRAIFFFGRSSSKK